MNNNRSDKVCPHNSIKSSGHYLHIHICFRSRTRLQKVSENGVELKPIVFALFSQNKLLIFSVDQPGLEPGTSRL